jgi:predicted Zn-dependent protease
MTTPQTFNAELLNITVDTGAGSFTMAQLADIQRGWMAQAAASESAEDFLSSIGITAQSLAAQEALALRDYQAGQYDSARRQFARLNRLLPGKPRLLKALAACQQALGAHAQALMGYREALAADPFDRSCLLHSAQCLLHLGRQADAARVLHALLAALEREPATAALQERARLLLNLAGPAEQVA